ncbi:MAG: nickel pincer cofactor biosynthesis protein LarC [Nitrospirae bacterium]|nr:nickel pincer cofactor biosynthesis protein LarC [Nitrospirota bacterium]
MPILYLDCSSGISGDMLLGAFIDAGGSFKELEKGLSRLNIKGYKLNAKIVRRAGFRATKVDVILKSGVRGQGSGVRRWKDINSIITKSSLPNDIKQKGLTIFKRLFEAEARVHGEKFEDVHLHELGGIDCIVDIVGTLICLDFLKIEKLYSSPLNLGSGTVRTEHGILPVPAPATIELLKNIPVYSSDIPFELTTPTGAVLMSTLAHDFGSMQNMQVSKIGIGAGGKDFKTQPNVLRAFIGQKSEVRSQKSGNNITVIETNIDDMNPQIYEYVMGKLFQAGALDVFLTPVIMKKGRPGIKLSALCSDAKKEDVIKAILRETTSIGVRFYEAERKILDREIKSIDTEFGKINVKVSKLGDDIIKTAPEYEDCRRIAKKLNMPLIEVMKRIDVS